MRTHMAVCNVCKAEEPLKRLDNTGGFSLPEGWLPIDHIDLCRGCLRVLDKMEFYHAGQVSGVNAERDAKCITLADEQAERRAKFLETGTHSALFEPLEGATK